MAGNDVLLKAEGHHAGGNIGITEYTAAPDFPGPPPHIHRAMTDMFFVLEGKLQFALEQYFKDLSAALAKESFSPDLVARVSANYDMEVP